MPRWAGARSFYLGLWGDTDWQLTRYFKARAGVRAALLGYSVHDRATDAVAEDRRSATGAVWGPRASVELSPTDVIALRAAYGEGYRSPQARSVSDGGGVPFAKVRTADLGVVFDWGAPLQPTLGGYYTRVSDDVAFDAEAGLLEAIGATQRFGAVVQARTKPWPWLVGSASLTVLHAALGDRSRSLSKSTTCSTRNTARWWTASTPTGTTVHQVRRRPPCIPWRVARGRGW